MECGRSYIHILLIIVIFSKMCFTNSEYVSNASISQGHSDKYVWDAWGPWSSCSRTCGGGVSTQERQCILKQNVISNPPVPGGTLAQTAISVRITREAPGLSECLGDSRRYRECNTMPCIGSSIPDLRAQQCAAYDRRPFKGRFYTWVPYVDGGSPCTLNCRPLGQLFYATLALVSDGTPCTKPGFRAACFQGSCKVIGRDSVLASPTARELRCGRQLVSGLFNRPRLPLGYTYITTVPRGACHLNVTMLVPSENYIALKLVNGSYIINGDFAVSTSGSYEAAGARFIYKRKLSQDHIFVRGPLLHPVDIMILYTQPNPNLKYEYFTGASDKDAKHDSDFIHNIPEIESQTHAYRHRSIDLASRNNPSKAGRHHYVVDYEDDNNNDKVNIVGARKFVWKITSYNQCSRSCGGGIQLGKYRCVEESVVGADREVSSVHCKGFAPPSRRRRCGFGPCPPKWRTAAWSTCPACGPANRTRIVGCVEDHSRGIVKVSNTKCPPSKPHTVELCNIPDCNEPTQLPSRSHVRQKNRDEIETFKEGPVYTLSVNASDNQLGPEYNFGTVGKWLYTNWTECVGWCVGGGIETRGVICADPSGCVPQQTPASSRTCTPSISCDKHDGQWFTGEWSPCSSQCNGRQVRGVLCIGGSGRHLKESACKAAKPENEQNCGTECTPIWYISDWGQCIGSCNNGTGRQRRTVWCARGNGTAAPDSDCALPRPISQQACSPSQCKAVVTTTKADIIPEQVTESQEKNEANEIPNENIVKEDCKDKLGNCQLAVQARLCHYNYYSVNCCQSCQRQ